MQLIIEGKTYVAPTAKARMVRKSVEISESTNFYDLKTQDLDRLVDFTVDVYGNQFTRDDVYDGVNAEDLIPTLIASIHGVSGELDSKLGQFPNDQAGQ